MGGIFGILWEEALVRLILAIGAGSFIGGVFRYILSLLIQGKAASVFPLGTLVVNLLGCFLVGVIFGFFDRGQLSHEWKLFLATGVVGGFTTFSAFSNESIVLLREGHTQAALLYIFSSVILGLLATYVAYFLARQ
ncbi:MAG: fluoride efflux transporter CrcB [Proteobacteria bacterium]|nr:fluoride efflux transporter CrcB [Cystobacterineae bacterium]MCL2259015.1 fluoride efflux transporter CrcB [Cystobacterineae bacterium]MCL2314631.1 fluoride efflux transporter CrcB [Pseudomonadota bacterium]